MKRIVILGTSCSGKTTFARKLSQRLGIAHVALDELYWNPDWQPKPKAEFQESVAQAIAQAEWIIDGNYGAVRELSLAGADTVVWLNYSLAKVFSRGLRRTVARVITRETLFAGNRESFRLTFFSRDSILLWILRTHPQYRREYPQLLAAERFQPLRLLEFKRPPEATRFLESLEGR